MYPYDEQTCFLAFGSWSYDDGQVRFTPKTSTLQLMQFVESSVWEYIESNLEERRRRLSIDDNLYHSDIVITIQMKRKFLYNNCNFFSLLKLKLKKNV